MTKFCRQEHFLDQDFKFQNIKMISDPEKGHFRWKSAVTGELRSRI